MSASGAPVHPSLAPQTAKLRILCLHGYLQNAEVFRGRIGSLRKALRSRAEFVFVDAPHLAQGEEAELRAAGGNAEAQPRAWWTWQDLDATKRPSKAAHYTGWPESLAALQAALHREQPIDGILGFSQGATAAALLLADMAKANGGAQSAPRFAILVSSFLPWDRRFSAELTAARVATPSLFIHGEADDLIPLERCEELRATFDPAAHALLTHPGGHFVPSCAGQVKQRLVKFLDRF